MRVLLARGVTVRCRLGLELGVQPTHFAEELQDVERLSQIVRALLLLSQAESGQVALHKTWLDLSASDLARLHTAGVVASALPS